MKKILSIILITAASYIASAQNPGDTIVVQAFDYSMTTGKGTGFARRMTVPFPTNSNLTYEKVILSYNMRCRDGNINYDGQENWYGCGAWDYSCNTYIYDSTRVDSLAATTPSHSISGFSGTTFNYTSSTVFDYYRSIQQAVTVNSIITETSSTIGSGSLNLTHPITINSRNAKSHYLFSATELLGAGAVAGELDGLALNVLNAGGNLNHFRVRLKHTAKSIINPATPDINGLTEVFYSNTTLINGSNRIQFYTPFIWDGTSNILVEFSFTNPDNTVAIEVEGEDVGSLTGLYTSGDRYFNYDGSNYIEADSYKGISGNNNRTIEAWINTSVNNKEITSWGLNQAGSKWVFRLNDDGTLRAEVHSGFKYGTTKVDDGQWHHVAVVFTGTNSADCIFYVDGSLEGTGGSQSFSVNTNTSSGINLRLSRGTNDRYFDGIIDEVRVWNSALTSTELSDWMYLSINPSHPKYSDLELYYKLNEGSGSTISDHSLNSRHATVKNGEIWSIPNGIDLFKEFESTTERPNLTFLQGDYTLTIANDTIFDSIARPGNTVTKYQVSPNYNTTNDDDILPVTTNQYWEAIEYYLYDENGNILETTPIIPTGSVTVGSLNYVRRMPMKFELISFVTPYGAGLDFGMTGKTWLFDLTDFTPILNGDKLLSIERGGQWLEDLDLKFLFIVGTPPRDVMNIQQIWRTDSKSYNSIMAETSFEPRDIKLNGNSSEFKVRSSITGHGQQGEFIPRIHYFNIDGGSKEFNWEVWKECAENPVYPQGGTWIYDRAGWCPGMPTDLQEFDINNLVSPGQTHNFDYGVNTASGTSNYIVNNQLVSYGPRNFNLDAAISTIKSPSNYVEFQRMNSTCTKPTIVIQNTGNTNLKELTIEYWMNNDSKIRTYTWTGNLPFLQKEEVQLPSPVTLWRNVSPTNNEFHVRIKNPNDGTDEYAFNNEYTSNFDMTTVVPEHILLNLRTNSAASESKYEIFDDGGNILYSRKNMNNNRTYRDTFLFSPGCYSLVFSDSDDDGIDFWANNDGKGAASLKIVGGSTIKDFELDFGKSLIYNFSIDYPLSYDELYNTKVDVYPNPAQSAFTISGIDINTDNVRILNHLGQIINIPFTKNAISIKFNSSELPSGIYFAEINKNGKIISRKIIIE